MLRAFTVENYRSFQQPSTIELRPITLLLGKNSSGKSSLTRLIPLLQQSLDRRTASPLLWTSDVVDFGDISNVLNHSHQDGMVELTFSVDSTTYYEYIDRISPYHYRSSHRLTPIHTMDFHVKLASTEGRTRYHSTSITIEDSTIEIFWGDKTITRITLDGVSIDNYPYGSTIFAETSNLFPTVSLRNPTSSAIRASSASASYYSPFGGLPAYSGLVDALEYFINKKTGQYKRDSIRRGLYYAPPSSIRPYVETLDNIVRSKLNHDHHLKALSAAMLVNDFPIMMSYVEARLRPFFESAAYLGPSRASGARFYRYQELSVDRIDSRGENLPMYLSSLSETELGSFNDIMASACGFTVRIKRTPGHASIEIGRSGESSFANIADVGFGFSQLLPIVAQIHAASNRSSSQSYVDIFGASISNQFLMAVEQPELHLHPALQEGLGDLFAAAVRPATRRKTAGGS